LEYDVDTKGNRTAQRIKDASGSPAKKARPLSDKERGFFTYTAGNYVKLKDLHIAEDYHA
ncbi:hypothetical protein ACG3P0_24795, partial [Pseudomonas aeruginosa]